MLADDHAAFLGIGPRAESVELSYRARALHTYVIGGSGTGKSTLLAQLGLSDVAHPDRHGLCVIDPHGSLVSAILDRVPPERADDVILIDPTDVDFPLAFNLFAPVPDLAKLDVYASELISVFERTFGAQWEHVSDAIRNVALTLLSRRPVANSDKPEDSPPAMDEIPSLLGLERVPEGQEKKPIWQQDRVTYRSLFYPGLASAGLMPVLEFWQNMYDNLTPRPKMQTIQRVQERINEFLTNPLLSRILAQSENKLDLGDAIESGKIILVNLSKSELGEANAIFLGSVLMARLTVAIFARGPATGRPRRPFHLIVDEFHNFRTSAFPTLLAEARKFDVDLVLAHQKRNQDSKNRTAISAANIICFQTEGDDHIDMAWQFDTTPPPGPPEFRPDHIAATPSLPVLPTIARPPLAQPDMGRCPPDVSAWLAFLDGAPSVLSDDTSVTISAEVFLRLTHELRDLMDKDPLSVSLVPWHDVVWPCAPVYSGDPAIYADGTSVRHAPPPRPKWDYRLKSAVWRLDDATISIHRSTIEWDLKKHALADDDPMIRAIGLEPAQPLLRRHDGAAFLLRDVLKPEFRTAIVARTEERARWLEEQKRAVRALNQEMPARTRPAQVRREPLVSAPGSGAHDEEDPLVSRPSDFRAPIIREALHSGQSYRRIAGNLSISENRSITSKAAGDESESIGASRSESTDIGRYLKYEGSTRSHSDIHLEIANQLGHLGLHRAMVRLVGEGADTNRIIDTMNLDLAGHDSEMRERIIERCRKVYCRPRQEVEKELRARYEARQHSVGNEWSIGKPLPPPPRYDADEDL